MFNFVYQRVCVQYYVVKKEPVSVNWQTLFILIPIVDLWATYRVQKLRLYLLIIYVGFGLGSIVIAISFFPEEFLLADSFSEGFSEVWIAITLAAYGLAIILIRKWSKKWNEKLAK